MMLNTPRRKKRDNGSQPPRQVAFRVHKSSRNYYKCDKCRKDHKECKFGGQSIQVLPSPGQVCDRCANSTIALNQQPCIPTLHRNSPYVQRQREKRLQAIHTHAVSSDSATAPSRQGANDLSIKPRAPENVPGHNIYSRSTAELSPTAERISNTTQPSFFQNQGMNPDLANGGAHQMSSFFNQQKHPSDYFQQYRHQPNQQAGPSLQDSTMQMSTYEAQTLQDSHDGWIFASPQYSDDALGENMPFERRHYVDQNYYKQDLSPSIGHTSFDVMDPALLAQEMGRPSKGKNRADRVDAIDSYISDPKPVQPSLNSQETPINQRTKRPGREDIMPHLNTESRLQFQKITTKLQNYLDAIYGCGEIQSKRKHREYTQVPDCVFAFVDFLSLYLRNEMDIHIQAVLDLALSAKKAGDILLSHYYLILLDRDVPSTVMANVTAFRLYNELSLLENQLDSPAGAKMYRKKCEKYSFPESQVEAATSSFGHQPFHTDKHNFNCDNEKWTRAEDNSALHEAVRNNDTSSILEWIEMYGLLDEPDRDAETLLVVAARAGHCEMAEILIRRNANINGLGGGFESPLHAAIDGKHPAMVKLLLSGGAKTDMARAKDGLTQYTLGRMCDSIDIRKLFQSIQQTGWNSAQCVQQNHLIDSTFQ